VRCVLNWSRNGFGDAIETTLDLKGDEEGVIVACGGVNGGYALFIADHKLHYDYNYFNATRFPCPTKAKAITRQN
jgi:hypothetical protein